MTTSAVRFVKDAEFEDVVARSDVPVLVDFMAPWCGPCNQMAPIIEDLAEEFAGEALICKMDVDQEPETAKRLGVRGLPTVLIIKAGEEAAREVGALTKTRLAAMIEHHLSEG